MRKIDVAVIGAGPAGMAAALAARKGGVKDVVVFERGDKAGGILPQCIHNGFGLHHFRQELTGPEYAERFLKEIEREGIEVCLNTMVVDITEEKVITTQSAEGAGKYEAKAVVLAMGCRERTRGAINIAGTRPAGVITAGAAQRFVNMEGYMPGREIVILGSGDIGLIMARRMTLEGAKVLAVCEIMPKSGGLQRNISQCLDDFGIPLLLSHTVCEIHGNKRVEGVTIAQVDEKFKVVEESKRFVKCDTLMLSVGLIPENELSLAAGVALADNGGAKTDKFMETNVAGIFACGNVVHVHDLVDFVTEESTEAGKSAANYVLGRGQSGKGYKFREKNEEEEMELKANERGLVCIVCPVGCRLKVRLDDDGGVAEVSENRCRRGVNYAVEEFTAPRRVLTSTVHFEVNGKSGFAPVKTNGTIPKTLLLDAMREIAGVRLTESVTVGTVVLGNILGTGVDVVVTDNVG